MPDSLHELLHPEAMRPLVTRFAEQSDEHSFISIYEEGEPIQANVDGTFKWEELRFSRALAPVAGLDAPSTAGPKLIQTPKTGSVVVIQEHVDLPMRFLEGLRAPGAEGANAAVAVNNHLKNLTHKVVRTKNYWAAKSLLTQGGAIDLKDFPGSQIASGPLTYPVQDLDAANSWATDGTLIRSVEINRLRKAYKQKAGLKPKRVIASMDVEGHLLSCDEIVSFIGDGSEAGKILARSFEEARQSDDAIVRLGGLQWAFVEDFYATDAAPDTPVDINAGDVFAVLPGPEMSQDCFAIAEGVQFVPSNPFGEVLGAPGNLVKAVRGLGAYVELTRAPVGIRLYVFWVGMLVQKMPYAVMVFDATP